VLQSELLDLLSALSIYFPIVMVRVIIDYYYYFRLLKGDRNIHTTIEFFMMC
jgi:hypothetical protein